MHGTELIEVWRDIIDGPDKCWVLFNKGTCVILKEPGGDLASQATALLREWGPVHPGSSFGDFDVITLDNGLGWVVTCHHNDILTFVGTDEVGPVAQDVVVGMLGRSKRDQDAEALCVLHTEDKRQTYLQVKESLLVWSRDLRCVLQSHLRNRHFLNFFDLHQPSLRAPPRTQRLSLDITHIGVICDFQEPREIGFT